MNVIERVGRRVDAFQQRHTPSSFVFGVVKKYGDDNGGNLSVLLSYAMFTTVFPLLLLLVTVLAVVLAHSAPARHAVLNSTFGQFPLVGKQLASNIHVLQKGTPFGFVVGIVGLVYGSTGLAGAGLYVMEQVWNIPAVVRPNYLTRMTRSLVFLAVLGAGLLVTTLLASFGTFGRHNLWLGALAEVLAAVVNVAIYLAAFRALTPRQVATRQLVPGSIFSGIVWTVLQAFGGYVIGHYLKGDNATYGAFGTVLGLLAWIYIGAEVTVYGAELNAVIAHRLWPRSIVQPPLTAADQKALTMIVTQDRRRPEQDVATHVHGRPMTEDEFRRSGYRSDNTVVGARKRAGPDGEDERAPRTG
jgi:YihY family inner membrane protein